MKSSVYCFCQSEPEEIEMPEVSDEADDSEEKLDVETTHNLSPKKDDEEQLGPVLGSLLPMRQF